MSEQASVNGRTWRAIQSRDLASLLRYFRVQVPEAGIGAHAGEIRAKFTLEASEIVRLCARLPERELHLLFRAALRLSCESVIGQHAGRGAPLPG
jgi:hypothetical protein